jgi:hypothetical protein
MSEIPADAPRSEDGEWWWDGAHWQPAGESAAVAESGAAAAAFDSPAYSRAAQGEGQLSEDGQWQWSGSEWQPADHHTTGSQSGSPPNSSLRSGSMAAVQPSEAAVQVQIHTVDVWFNVFIPDHKVQVADTCFLGDDRSFSTDRHASSRLRAAASVRGLGTSSAALVSDPISSDDTRQVSCDGSDSAVAQAPPSHTGGFSSFAAGNVVADPEGGVYDNANAYVATFELDVSASDPLVLAAPSVGVSFFISIDPVAATIRVQGVTDLWPAFEGYARADGGAIVPLLQQLPPAGTDPWSLVNSRNHTIDATASLG